VVTESKPAFGPIVPRPPASETAAARSASVIHAIGARMMGYSIPNISVILVFISIPHSLDELTCPYGEHQGPRTRQKAEQLYLITIIREKKWELIMLPAPLVFEPIRLFI